MPTKTAFSHHSGKLYFRFLDLPPEIQNTVYELTLPSQSSIGITWPGQDLSLWYVSRQVQGEFSAVLYDNCIFEIDLTICGNYAKFLEWIYGLSNEDVSRIMRLRFVSTINSPHSDCPIRRHASFTLWSKAQSSAYALDYYLGRSCRYEICANDHIDIDDGVTRHLVERLAFIVQNTRRGSLSAGEVVAWVSAVLECGTF